MGRSKGTAVLVAMTAVLIGVLPGGALAGETGSSQTEVRVQTLNYVYNPDPLRIDVGTLVTWRNPVPLTPHTATGEAPLSLFDSGEIPTKGTWSYTFTAAGTYPYFCTLHERFNMFSSVLIPDQVDPPGGPVGTVFTITVASLPGTDDLVYDIQRRDPGQAWKNWMPGVRTTTVQFDSTGKQPGTYLFRSRLHRLSDDATSDYSPPVSISVT